MIPQHLKKKRSLPSLSTFIHSHFGIGSRPNIPPKTGTWWFTRSVRQAAMSFHFFKSAKALLCLLALCKTFDDRGIDHLSLTSETKSEIRKKHRISLGHEIRYESFWVGTTLAKSGFWMNHFITWGHLDIPNPRGVSSMGTLGWVQFRLPWRTTVCGYPLVNISGKFNARLKSGVF